MGTYRVSSANGVVARIVTAQPKVFRVSGSPRGPIGPNGKSVEIQSDGTNIQWRNVGDLPWINIVSLASLVGPAGPAIEMQIAGGYIQWRVVGDVSWTNLIALSELIGPAGADGTNGSDGTDGLDGVDGRTVLSGSGAPSSGLGNDGDFYIDTVDYLIYGPKTAGAWGSGTSLVGPAGAGSGDVTGPTGATANGLARYSGTTGKIIKDSNVTVDDSGNIATPGTVDGRDVSVDGTKLDGVAAGADVTATQLPVATHAATSKTTPVDADEIPIADSAASFGLKRLTWANLKATAKSYFDTLYATISSVAAKADDSAVVHNTGAETVAGIKTFSSSPVVPTPSSGTQAANKDYVDAGFGSNSFVFNANVTGIQDSSNTQFTTPDDYVTGTLEVYLNGVLQQRSVDYSETTPGSGLFDFVGYAPSSSDVVTVSYQTQLTAVAGNADTIDGFHASSTPTANNILPLDSNGKLPPAILGTPTSDEVVLGSTFAITAANDTWQNSGFEMTLPEAGTYEIGFDARIDLVATTAPSWSSAKMYDATAAADVPNTERLSSITQVVSVVSTGTGSCKTEYTVTGASVIRLYVKWKNGALSTKNLTSTTDGRTTMWYRRIS